VSKNPNPAEWLTGIVLGAASISPTSGIDSSKFISRGIHEGIDGQYEIFGIKDEENPEGIPLVKTEIFKIFITKNPNGQLGLMKINNGPENLEVIKREARILEELQSYASEVDKKAESNGDQQPHYGAMFPRVLDSLSPADGLFAIFLGYDPAIESYKQLTPMSLILKENKRVDLKTIQWIFGKLLKLLDYLNELEYVVGKIDFSNVLLETELHGVFIFDFSEVNISPTRRDYKQEVADAANLVWFLAGGSETEDPPYDSEIMSHENYLEYVSFLKRIKNGITEGAYFEFEFIYEMGDRIWPQENNGVRFKRQWHEFRTYPNKKREEV